VLQPIKTLVKKKIKFYAKIETKNILLKTLSAIVKKHTIGWKVQELNWMHNNDAINISFIPFLFNLLIAQIKFRHIVAMSMFIFYFQLKKI
jgi:hypothetical protein